MLSCTDPLEERAYDKERAKEVRELQIIQTTLDLFVERGYYGTKTSQISRRAGISEGLLFHYFPTKEALLEELINIGLEGMRTPMQMQAKNGLDFFCQFTEMLFANVKKNRFIAQICHLADHAKRETYPPMTKICPLTTKNL